jgi:hypothetical protein
MSKKVGLSSLLAHFEESLQRAGSADIAARLATLRERYQAGSTSYSTALSELEGMVGHEAVLDAAQLAAAHVKDAGADPTPPLSDSLQGGVLKREVGSTAEERAPEGATAGSLLGISTVHGGPSSSRQDAAAAPWAGHFSFDQQQNPAVGKAAVPLMPLVVEEGPSSSTQGGAEEAAGAPIPLSIRVDVAEPGPSSPSRRKRPREPAPAPVAVGRGGGAGLAAERPQRARKGTTRYDPDDVATVPQMGGRGRRAAESAPGDSSPLLNSRATPPPPSPRVAAASAVLMGAACAAHHQAEASMSGGWAPRAGRKPLPRPGCP